MHKNKLAIADIASHAQHSTEHISPFSKQDTTETSSNIDAASSVVFQSRSRRSMQNFLLVRLGANLLVDNDDFQHSLIQLRTIVNIFEYFSDPDPCTDYLTTIEDEQVFLIVSERYGENIVPLIHDMPQIDSMFVFCSNSEQQEELLTNWPKVKGIYSLIQSVCTSLNKIVLKCEQNLIPMSFVPNQILAAETSGHTES
ncbi:unnamed protein product [Rotaria socialis]|uniref:Uncharacterized protein n=1 Tax=Rotaria socialis TaxID=392032 RepID=A0A818TMX5_9BILA|nr:unnamed protein product [Rotaria socialis]CAF4511282.1 unnamed protein product [Rotaria socialis]